MVESPNINFLSVTKRFGEAVAIDRVSCEVRAGSLHAFLGENGAGKSTLMKILAGTFQPDSGRVLLNGVPALFRTPIQARAAGIGMVYQHFTLIPSMTILDNVLLGDNRLPFILRRSSIKAQVAADAKSFGFEFDLSALVLNLAPAGRQKLEIFKLLRRKARVLILDEPTSQLAPFEAEEVLSILGALAARGRTILMVSHNIDEVLRFATRITILRRGRCIDTLDPRTIGIRDLARKMVGDLPEPPPRALSRSSSPPILALQNVTVKRKGVREPLASVSLEVRSGEVLGVAGVAGSGQEELVRILTGHLRPNRGSLKLNGQKVPWRSLRGITSSLGHVPADVANDGCMLQLSLLRNLFLRDFVKPQYRNGPFLRLSAMADESKNRLAHFQVRPNDPELPCRVLSGGNLQRLILARELAHDSCVLVVVNPSAGLDVAAAGKVAKAIRDYAESGKSVVLVSHDLRELLETSDRVVVFFQGRVASTEPVDTLDSERLGLLMGGISREIVAALSDSKTAGGAVAGRDLRLALHTLLDSSEHWKRRLAAQISLRVFAHDDVEDLKDRLTSESHPEVKALLAMTIARAENPPYLESLLEAFRQQPDGFVEAQRRLIHASDLTNLKDELKRRLRDGAALVESLVYVLVLDYLGVSIAGDLREKLRKDYPKIVELSGLSSCT